MIIKKFLHLLKYIINFLQNHKIVHLKSNTLNYLKYLVYDGFLYIILGKWIPKYVHAVMGLIRVRLRLTAGWL